MLKTKYPHWSNWSSTFALMTAIALGRQKKTFSGAKTQHMPRSTTSSSSSTSTAIILIFPDQECVSQSWRLVHCNFLASNVLNDALNSSGKCFYILGSVTEMNFIITAWLERNLTQNQLVFRSYMVAFETMTPHHSAIVQLYVEFFGFTLKSYDNSENHLNLWLPSGLVWFMSECLCKTCLCHAFAYGSTGWVNLGHVWYDMTGCTNTWKVVYCFIVP